MPARRPITPRSGARAAGAGGPRPRSRTQRPGSRPPGAASSSGRIATPARGVERAPAAATLPRLFTVRVLVLFVVGLLAFVLLFPTVRAYLTQKADNARLVQQVAQAREQNDNLESELKRWDDPAYVAAQARERLAFVLPGDTAFRVVDPESVPDPVAPAVAAAGSGPEVIPDGTTTPWYTTIWGSVRAAGEADVAPTAQPTAPPKGNPAAPPPAAPPTP